MKQRMFIFVALSVSLLLSFSFFSNATDETDSTKLFNTSSQITLAGEVINVPQDFIRIQDAIGNSTSGNVILVSPGTYRENLVINKNVFLIGMNQSTTIIEGQRNSSVVTIRGDNVLLTGFTIKNTDFQYGIKSNGVQIENSVGALVQHNSIINNFDGIKLSYATSNRIRWNHLFNNQYGIFLSWSNRNSMYANNVYANYWNGIELDWSDQNVIDSNSFSFNTGYGLEIPTYAPGRDNLIFHNNFFNNTFHNSFLYNTLGVSVSDYVNVWSRGYPDGGNFWGSYVGVDEFSGLGQDQPGSDGIIDEPCRIDGNNVDPFPLATLFNPSPATSLKASFSFSPESPAAGSIVAFNASVSTHPNDSNFSFFWNFGDGVISRGVNATHSYTSAGTFYVHLYVLDNEEGLLAIESRLVIVDDQLRHVATSAAIGIAAIAIVAVFAYFTRKKKQASKRSLEELKLDKV